ncbi:hypothetical protein FA13DRAFT_1732592 [Coprinellus micaceus]|uniref:Uncharacterized protein n=1 Tax=Coprinellus micaceus TaxID=71717 RepID=A0A4Y7TDT6_COPMI|nr:hypothetical protein FA13DRAFT_1732592 [Coprinellus micaceus]
MSERFKYPSPSSGLSWSPLRRTHEWTNGEVVRQRKLEKQADRRRCINRASTFSNFKPDHETSAPTDPSTRRQTEHFIRQTSNPPVDVTKGYREA